MWRRLVKALVRRVNQMEGSPIVRERPRKTIGQTIKKVLDLNGLYLSMIYDRIL